METVKETEMEAEAETETAVEAQAESGNSVETQAEMEVTGGSGTGNSAVQTGDSSNLFVYAGTLLLAAAAFVFSSEEEIRKNNSDAEGIRTI